MVWPGVVHLRPADLLGLLNLARDPELSNNVPDVFTSAAHKGHLVPGVQRLSLPRSASSHSV
jgi:hypothetical protein